MKTIRIALADPHPVTRLGVRAVLERASDIEVVGEADQGRKIDPMLRAVKPHLLIIDLSLFDQQSPMLEKSAREVVARLEEFETETRVLVLSAPQDPELMLQVVKDGVVGYLDKNEPPEVILQAVQGVMEGEARWFSPEVLRKAMRQQEQRRELEALKLTERQKELLRLLVQGKTNAEIADELALSVHTIKNHLTTLYSKLDVKSRAEAIFWVHQHELI